VGAKRHMRVHFVRHGESDYNVLGLANGDPARAVSLTSRGREQAEAAAAALAGAAIAQVLVSEFPRARETAAIINRRHGAPMRIDSRLNDRRSGFEGRPIADYLAAVSDEPIDTTPAGGESYREEIGRVLSFLADLESLPGDEILVVTHHEILQIVSGHYAGLDPIAMWRTPVANGQVISLDLPSQRPLRGAA
jgi:alpha-ribazole phosphatase